MAAGSIVWDLIMRTGSFTTDTQRAAKDLAKLKKEAYDSGRVIGESIRGIAASLGVGLSIAGLTAFVTTTNAGVDALNDLKDATGASIENISALEDVAGRTGTSFETVGASLIKLNNALKEAKPGSDIDAALKAIGLSAKELKALDPAEALRRTAVALSSFADDGNKARLSQVLFQKSLEKVAPFLKDLAEQTKLVGTLTAKQTEEAEKFGKELFTLQKNVVDLSRSLTGPLISSFNELIDKFRKARAEGTGLFASLKSLGEQQVLKDRIKAANPRFLEDSEVARETSRLARRRTVEFNGAPDKPKTGRAKSPFDLDDGAKRLIESLNDQIAKTENLTQVEQTLYDLRKLGSVPFDQAARAISLAQEIDKTKEATEAIKLKREAIYQEGKAVEDANEVYQARLKTLIDATPSAVLEKQRADVKLLTDEFQRFIDTFGQAGISEATYLEAVSELLDLNKKELEKVDDLAHDLGLTFTSAFENAVVEGMKLSDVLKGLEKDIIRIITRKLITEPLGNAVTNVLSGVGGAGGIFGAIGKWFGIGGSATVGASGIGTAQPFASGTDYVPRDMLARIHKGERIIPAAENKNWNGGGTSIVFTLNQSFAPGTSRATVLQGAVEARREIERARRNM